MSTSVLRTADAWWVLTPTGAATVAHQRHHHRRTAGRPGGDRPRPRRAADTVPVDGLALVSPVTAPCRVVAQMTNFASHVTDAGMNPDDHPA